MVGLSTFPMLRVFENKTQRLLARSSLAARMAVKLRNQANCVIGYHLGESSNADANGEDRLLSHLSPLVKTFVDVGANVGNWSEPLLANGCTGYLFEPSQQSFSALQKRFPQAKLRNVAVSDAPGSAVFAEEEDCGERSSLSDARAQNVTEHSSRCVSIVTLDDEFPGSEEMDFLKIDTEGHDLKVLKGATRLLARTRFVQFEYNSYWVSVGSSLAEALRLMESMGFVVFLIRSTGLHPLRYSFWSDYFRYSNFFACRPGDLETVRPLIGKAF